MNVINRDKNRIYRHGQDQWRQKHDQVDRDRISGGRHMIREDRKGSGKT